MRVAMVTREREVREVPWNTEDIQTATNLLVCVGARESKTVVWVGGCESKGGWRETIVDSVSE